ncbi:MAG: isoprenylcysteine carboxylmethyltransferase family protein, partial [Cyanobacteria bacterium]|nr:isoprenylcysteine carboxylmethyltransferase family protein [Cyanobacteriota bacterium]
GHCVTSDNAVYRKKVLQVVLVFGILGWSIQEYGPGIGLNLQSPFYLGGGDLISPWLGLLCVTVGLSFAVWSRKKLGSQWDPGVTPLAGDEIIPSGETNKKEKRIILPKFQQSGPYQWVRHPIYAGFLLAMLGHILIFRDLEALCIWLGLWGILIQKSNLEEAYLVSVFPEAYPLYQQKVKRWIPFVI